MHTRERYCTLGKAVAQHTKLPSMAFKSSETFAKTIEGHYVVPIGALYGHSEVIIRSLEGLSRVNIG